MSELDRFTRGYLDCLVWQATDGSDEGVPLDTLGFTADDFDDAAVASSVMDCEDFQDANSVDLDAYQDAGHSLETAGFDFCLTRNGHGAGFWDRGLGALGDRLTEASKPYGGVDVYVIDGERLGVQ